MDMKEKVAIVACSNGQPEKQREKIKRIQGELQYS